MTRAAATSACSRGQGERSRDRPRSALDAAKVATPHPTRSCSRGGARPAIVDKMLARASTACARRCRRRRETASAARPRRRSAVGLRVGRQPARRRRHREFEELGQTRPPSRCAHAGGARRHASTHGDLRRSPRPPRRAAGAEGRRFRLGGQRRSPFAPRSGAASASLRRRSAGGRPIPRVRLGRSAPWPAAELVATLSWPAASQVAGH